VLFLNFNKGPLAIGKGHIGQILVEFGRKLDVKFEKFVFAFSRVEKN
jgi:hypothetical protein